MGKPIYSMGVSADGFIEGPDAAEREFAETTDPEAGR
jgi:hypothetical protein